MRLLVGVDGSDGGYRALDAAVERANAGHDVTVAVVDNPDAGVEPGTVERRVADELAAASVDATIVTLTGHPGSELVDLAEAESFDRVLIGGGERSPMGKISLGTVTEFVLLNSHVTVTLVR